MTKRPYSRRIVGAWSLYDFANSAFTTVVVTFIYSTYFTQAIAEDEIVGTSLWSRAVSISAITVAILSPYVGAVADRGGYRKRFLLITTVLCVVGSFILYFVEPGQVIPALLTFVVADIAFEMANVFYNAFLPDIAPAEKIGRISGYGWALGYAGGLLCLIIGYYGLVAPETPPFGLSAETGEHVRANALLVAVWFALFSIPIFFSVRERKPLVPQRMGPILRSATRELIGTFNEIRRFKDMFWMLLARMVYNDGLVTIFAFGGIYAAGTFGFETADYFMLGIVLNVAAGLGAFGFGFVDDRLGGKRTILISLVVLTAASSLALLATTRTMFWIAAITVGICAGPNQSASRSLMGRFTPLTKENEFYGFFALSGKATAFMGPLLFGSLSATYNSQRAGMASVILFFIVGGLLLLKVNEKRGAETARAESQAIEEGRT